MVQAGNDLPMAFTLTDKAITWRSRHPEQELDIRAPDEGERRQGKAN